MNVMESTDPSLLADDIEEDKKAAAIAAWHAKGGWDTWTLRYNLYGLLTYEKYFPNDEVIDACRKMADLLIDTYGPGKADLTKYGSRQGISATTLLESIIMLYERTGEKKYLDFAEHIVAMSENNPALRLMGTMLEGGSVVHPGDGKGYQLMANLLGYLRLYRCTGNEKYLQTVLTAREQIKAKHLLVNGGPWTRKMPYNGNNECFAYTEAFHPEKIVVEGCCDATWIQLNTHLFELTGMAEYFNEAEVTLINNVYQHQHLNGIEWCYMTVPNQERPKYEARFHCCASSEPRGMEIYSSHLAGEMDNRLSVNTFSPSTIQLPDQFGGGNLTIEGTWPLGTSAEIHLDIAEEKEFMLEFRLPANSKLVSVKVNGESTKAIRNERGFIEIKRKWKKGDAVAVELKYELKAHLQEGEEDRRWVSYSYGPIALAQKISEMPDEEPLKTIDFAEPSDLLKMLKRSSVADIAFLIKGTDVTLIPYYQTGSEQSGSKTYFEL
jgi:DUF1680 family protein